MTRLIQLDTTGLEGLESLRDKLAKTRLHTDCSAALTRNPDHSSSAQASSTIWATTMFAPTWSGALKRAYILLPSLMGGSDEDY